MYTHIYIKSTSCGLRSTFSKYLTTSAAQSCATRAVLPPHSARIHTEYAECPVDCAASSAECAEESAGAAGALVDECAVHNSLWCVGVGCRGEVVAGVAKCAGECVRAVKVEFAVHNAVGGRVDVVAGAGVGGSWRC